MAVETQSTESVKHSQRDEDNLGGAGVKLRVRINPGDHNLTVIVDGNGTVSTLKQVIVRDVQEVCLFVICLSFSSFFSRL
jgi:hypothetical protein